MTLTSKQRSYLKSIAQTTEASFQLGKGSVTPEFVEAIRETFNTKELVKINILKNCFEEPKELANTIADRTGSTLVQVIGRKIVLYKPDKDNPVIKLPQ